MKKMLALATTIVLAGCGTDPSPQVTDYVVVHRAWEPGERAAQVAAIKATNALGMYTALVDSLLPLDSITMVVPDPAAGAALSVTRGLNPSLAAATTAGMVVVGMDLYVVDTSTYVPPEVPSDSIKWLMVFWYNASEPTYNGFTVVHSATATTPPAGVDLNTTDWEAAGHYAGGGGGEVRASTGQSWLVTSGDMNITFNDTRGAAGSTVTSGPFTGGIQRNGTMRGKLSKVVLAGSTTQPNFTLDFSKAASSIPAARLECVYPTPCTGPTLAPGMAPLFPGESMAEPR